MGAAAKRQAQLLLCVALALAAQKMAVAVRASREAREAASRRNASATLIQREWRESQARWWRWHARKAVKILRIRFRAHLIAWRARHRQRCAEALAAFLRARLVRAHLVGNLERWRAIIVRAQVVWRAKAACIRAHGACATTFLAPSPLFCPDSSSSLRLASLPSGSNAAFLAASGCTAACS